jgi:hypothetical protein
MIGSAASAASLSTIAMSAAHGSDNPGSTCRVLTADLAPNSYDLFHAAAPQALRSP